MTSHHQRSMVDTNTLESGERMPQDKYAPPAYFEYHSATKHTYFAPGSCSSARSTGTATPDLLSDASSQFSWVPLNSQSSAQTTPDSAATNIRPSLVSGPYLGSLQAQTDQVDVTSWRDGVERETPTVPLALRLNARRSRSVRSDGPPSTLVRQPERRLCFVSSLVVFASGLISSIWPLSSPVFHDTKYANSVLPLQDFITETLRRSKTSYSTLQVAMFYLILLKDNLPKCDFTQEQSSVSGECRAMQCGRRMFLSALMLASKFLQDRNYSTRAWGKITGLPTAEINRNELKFLEAVNWKLHVGKEKFERWSHIVIVLSAPPPPNLRSHLPSLVETIGWGQVLGRLSADCQDDFSAFRNEGNSFGHAMKAAELYGLLTPPSSPPDTTTSYPEDVVPEEERGEIAEEITTPLAPPPAPHQSNLPTPRGTPRLPHSQGSMYVPDTRCRESLAALAMLKACAKPANRELCPPPKPCSASFSRLQSRSRRSSVSSSSAVSISTSNSSPPSLCSDISSMPSRSRSSSISEMDAMAHLRALQTSDSAMQVPWLSASPKTTDAPASDCSSLAGMAVSGFGEMPAVPLATEPGKYVLPVRADRPSVDVHSVPSIQPLRLDEDAKRSCARRCFKSKNKRSHSKTDISALVNIPEDDVQSLVRKELMGNLSSCPSVSTEDNPRDHSRSSFSCKRNRRSKDPCSAVEYARVLLCKKRQEKCVAPGRRASSQTSVSALSR